jgi:hypothetical protein
MKTTAAILVAGLTVGCVVARPVPTNPKPEAKAITVDFSAVLEGRKESQSVYFAPGANLLRRVALSPNLVFEAARSSSTEPATAGPEGGSAVGRTIAPWLSYALLKELKRYDANPIPTVALPRTVETGGTERVLSGSWVERIIERNRHPVGKPRATEDVARDAPSSILAVREFEVGTLKVSVVTERTSAGDLLVRFERRPGEPSACPSTSIEMPLFRFSAEVLSANEGRYLARISESTVPGGTKDLAKRSITGTSWESEVVARAGATDGTTTYEASWKARDVSCENAMLEFEKVRSALAAVDRDSVAKDLVSRGLAPLVLTGR